MPRPDLGCYLDSGGITTTACPACGSLPLPTRAVPAATAQEGKGSVLGSTHQGRLRGHPGRRSREGSLNKSCQLWRKGKAKQPVMLEKAVKMRTRIFVQESTHQQFQGGRERDSDQIVAG